LIDWQDSQCAAPVKAASLLSITANSSDDGLPPAAIGSGQGILSYPHLKTKRHEGAANFKQLISIYPVAIQNPAQPIQNTKQAIQLQTTFALKTCPVCCSHLAHAMTLDVAECESS
jgi:hypothetical protein